jgi:primosomal protein N' (replication factor Y) (superfamily II helicase)
MFVDILLPNHLNQAFTYRVPEGLRVGVGDYVLVPFAGRMLPAVVWGEGSGDVASNKIKPIAEALTHLPPMPAGMREFVERAARYTLSPRGAVLKMCLPSFAALHVPTARERAASFAPVCYTPPSLTDAQAVASDTLKSTVGARFSVSVLDGVTGSGKTEVYFDAMAGALAAGKQVLVLLPEIALSVQWLSRFEARFGTRPHIWHSSISPAQRKHTWRAIVRGEAQVVVGARSALFLPYANVGMVVVDEEHEATFKQDDGVMYHARDMAVMKAHIEKIPVVLASATPSLETWHNVQQKKYQLISLPKRYTGVELPQVQLVDMRQETLGRGDFLAKSLMDSVVQAMADGKQALLFLNRRGYAPLMLCQHCGHRFECKSCSAWLVQHKHAPRLSCHHCGHAEMVPKACPACGSEEKLQAVGPGIERIAEEIARRIPDARVAVLSSDNESHDEVQQVLAAMQNGELDVLIGTQLIAKGHHFPKLRVVGVVDADLGLEGGDPRAVERTYQVLHQIGGRAGREEERGLVFIQTYAPTHPVMKALAAGERDALMELELKMRKVAHMPPFSRLANVLIDGTDERTVLTEARRLASVAPNHPKLRVLGPAPAPLYRLKNRFRVRILLQADRALDMQHLVVAWLEEAKPARAVHIKVDVDPYHFM